MPLPWGRSVGYGGSAVPNRPTVPSGPSTRVGRSGLVDVMLTRRDATAEQAEEDINTAIAQAEARASAAEEQA